MRTGIFRVVAIVGFCAVMMTGSAVAQGRGNASGVSNGNHDWRGDRDRWTFGDDQRPRGWEKGKKTGWGDCDLPPGQAKKMGCTSSWSGVRSERREDWRTREREQRVPDLRYQKNRRNRDHDHR